MNEQQINSKGQAWQSFLIPIAIIIGFSLIAGAIFFSGNSKSQDTPGTKTGDDTTVVDNTAKAPMNPVTEDDHILGNPDAPIKLVEYSDYDCPFCRVFHDTMTKIMDEYGPTGQVAWVYRQLPLQKLHPNAPIISKASECVASIGGNDAFWKFNDAVNTSRAITYNPDGSLKGIEPTNMALMPNFVAAAGDIDTVAFDNCMSGSEAQTSVEEDFNNAIAMGINSTPTTILVFGDKQGSINGAQTYEVVKQIIDGVIKQTETE